MKAFNTFSSFGADLGAAPVAGDSIADRHSNAEVQHRRLNKESGVSTLLCERYAVCDIQPAKPQKLSYTGQ